MNIIEMLREREIATNRNENMLLILLSMMILFFGLIIALFIRIENINKKTDWELEYYDDNELFDEFK